MGRQFQLQMLVAVLVFSFVDGQDNAITCTAGEFSRLETGSITCHFNENLKTARRNFNIVLYPYIKSSSGGESGTYVLVCNWGQTGDKPQCKTEDGFSFRGDVSDVVKLEIPDVMSKVGGVYVCQVVPDQGLPLETCTLTVKDTRSISDLGHCPVADCASQDGVIAVLIIALFILALLVVFAVLYIKKRYHVVRKSGDSARDVCCGYSLQRKVVKVPADTVVVTDPESAVMFVKNEADLQKKKGGATPENVPLITLENPTSVATTKPQSAAVHQAHSAAVQPHISASTSSARPLGNPVSKTGQQGPADGDVQKRREDSEPRPGSYRTRVEPTPADQGVEPRGKRVVSSEREERASERPRPKSDHTAPNTRGHQRNARYRDDDNDEDNEDDEDDDSYRGARGSSQPKASDLTASRKPQEPPLKIMEYKTWGTDDVCRWLKQMNFSQVVEAFRAGNVTGKTICGLDKGKLKKMNITDKKVRDALLDRIKGLKKEADAQKTTKKHEEENEKKRQEQEQKREKKEKKQQK